MNDLLDEFRSTYITWDKATRRIYSPISANESDSNGRKLNIQVVNSGQVENLTGATLHLYWETKDKAQHGLDAFTASDITKGEFEMFYTTGMLSNVGELNATLVLVDVTGQVVSDWFKITVVRGIDGDAIQSENSFSSLTQALIDIGNLEQSYAPRLNDLTAQLQQKANNPNLVDKLEKLIQFRGMYIRTASDGSLRVGVGMNKETNSVVEYRFLNNADNLLLLRGVYSGVEDANYQPNVTMVGAFNTSTEGQYYTTEVGAKLTFNFTGDKLFFKRRTESRGGMWKFTLSTGEVRYASCFSDPGGYKEDLVFANLANTTHHVVAEFIGADPDNPPTATPRGYFYQSTIGDKPFRQANVLPINETTAKEVVGSNSVPDYAIQGRKSGTSTSFEWSPVHGVASGVSVDVVMKIKGDGVILGAVAGQMPQIDFKEIKNFELSQFFRVVNPNAVGDGKLWEHTLSHIIDERNPFLTIQSVMMLLQNVEFGSGYFGMLPSRQSTMQRLVLNNGAVYAPLTTEAQEDYYGADVTSAAFTGDYAQGIFHGVAIDISSPEEIYNLGKNIEPNQKARISFRPNDVAKVYFTSFRGGTALIGERFTSQNRICAVSGVQFPNVNLGM